MSFFKKLFTCLSRFKTIKWNESIAGSEDHVKCRIENARKDFPSYVIGKKCDRAVSAFLKPKNLVCVWPSIQLFVNENKEDPKGRRLYVESPFTRMLCLVAKPYSDTPDELVLLDCNSRKEYMTIRAFPIDSVEIGLMKIKECNILTLKLSSGEEYKFRVPTSTDYCLSIYKQWKYFNSKLRQQKPIDAELVQLDTMSAQVGIIEDLRAQVVALRASQEATWRWYYMHWGTQTEFTRQSVRPLEIKIKELSDKVEKLEKKDAERRKQKKIMDEKLKLAMEQYEKRKQEILLESELRKAKYKEENTKRKTAKK